MRRLQAPLPGEGRHPGDADRRGDATLTAPEVREARVEAPGGTWRGLVRVGAALPQGLLSDPPSVLRSDSVRILREKKNDIVDVPDPSGATPGWIVRRYRPRGVHAVLRNSMMVSKEHNAFTFALEYERRGVSTAPALAILERYSGGVFQESLLVTAKVPSRTLRETLDASDAAGAGEKERGRTRRAWLRALAGFVRDAHAKGVYHLDLNQANVLVPESRSRPGPDAFVLIDVNRTVFGPPFVTRLAVRDLMRVASTPRERSFVLRAYSADGREYARLRRLVSRVRAVHDTRKRLNRSLGVKKALRTLKIR